ncbi:hypothetical protein [Roseococcus sp. YIM B11640]|uniref:hypothetical protein n=1 Tax=Roseococcus sp. YIM B11640 TaxID=3133973 RepID=UPI003C7C2FEF
MYRILTLAVALAGLPALSPAAWAQQRVVVVPAGSEVVIPSRGAVPQGLASESRRPRLPRPPSRGSRQLIDSADEGALGGTGLAAPALLALPLAAAAALLAANATPGSGSSTTSAPARTR